MTTGKTRALTRWTFVGKVTSLLFNMLSRWVIAFLPRSKHLLISRLQSPSAVILEPQKIKSLTVSIVSLSICHEAMGLDAMILVFWMLSLSQLFNSPLSLSSRGSLVVLCFLPHRYHQMVNNQLKSDWLYSLQPKIEKRYTISKNKTRSWLWLRSWTPYCKIQT